jgi:hypothetical protein
MTISPREKGYGHETNHSPPTEAEIPESIPPLQPRTIHAFMVSTVTTLTTRSVVRNGRIIVNDELGKIWKQSIMAYFKTLYQHLSEGSPVSVHRSLAVILHNVRYNNVKKFLENKLMLQT